MIELSKNASAFLNAFNDAVDNFFINGVDFNTTKLMTQFKLKLKDIPSLQSRLQSNFKEFELALSRSDEQVNEAYSHLPKSKIRNLVEKYNVIMSFSNKTKKQVAQGTSHNALFAICKKYNVIRCFVGNVQVDGSKVSANESYLMSFKSKVNLDGLVGKSYGDIVKFLEQGKKSPRSVNTISGKTVDAILKF